MPVLVVRDMVHGNQSCCNLNEGIGKVMRFGAYGEDVQTRLRWMRDTLAPVLQEALSLMENGVDLTAMMAQAITMGDEFHQRNIAASSLLLRTLSPVIAGWIGRMRKLSPCCSSSASPISSSSTAMAYSKAVMDAAAEIKAGSVVTAMTRNGREFGIRVSGTGDRWFTAPVNTPQGLFFTGYSRGC